jgi:5-methyltetrahydrofolate--homocysteine methyltransferase
MEILQQISESLQRGEHEQVAELTKQAIDAGLSAPNILNDGLMTGMDVVGQRFGAHEIFLPELLLSARAMNAGIDLLKPLFVGGEMPTQGKVVIGTVKGDLHDIGKNLVGIMLKGAGKVKVIVGGAPLSKAFADEIGADAYGYDAGNAVEIVKELAG